MPTAAELGDVALQGLSALLKALSRFFIYLKYTGNNESVVNASRGNYQSFWEAWYHINAMISWFRKLLFEANGLVWQINHNSTLENEFAKVVSIAANNSTKMIGDVSGTYGITFILRSMSDRVANNPDFVYNIWFALKHAIILIADALKPVPTYFT